MPIVRNGREQLAAEGQEVAQRASREGQDVAASASGQARETAGTVREQSTQLTQELSGQGRELLQETRRQVEDQAENQTQVLAQTLHRWGQETEALVEGRPEDSGAVGDCARQVADKLHDMASEIEMRGVSGLVEEIQDFGRRRPGAFLVGAAIIGFGGARLIRSAGGGDQQSTGEADLAVEADGARSLPPARPAARRRPRRPRSSAELVGAGSTTGRNPASAGGE